MDNEAFEDNENKEFPVPRRRRRQQGIAAVFSWREVASDLIESHQRAVTWTTFLTLGLAYHAYLVYCIYRSVGGLLQGGSH